MFRTSIIALAILITSQLFAREINILFIGNSFTARHDIPKLVTAVIEEGQDAEVYTKAIIYGGKEMFRHHSLFFSGAFIRENTISSTEIDDLIFEAEELLELEEAPDFFTEYMGNSELPRYVSQKSWPEARREIKWAIGKLNQLQRDVESGNTRKWDYVVLQSWQDITPYLDQGYAKYVQEFAKIAKSQGTKVILYITSPHSQNKEPVDAPLEEERTLLELELAQELAEKINAHAVVPVPLGVKKLQEGGTSIALRYENDGHLNQYCAYLTANMFYAAMFKKSTIGFEFDTVTENKLRNGKDPDGGDPTVVMKGDVKKQLQSIAYQAVAAFDKGELD